jgi:hypothetical protein
MRSFPHAALQVVSGSLIASQTATPSIMNSTPAILSAFLVLML